MYEQLLQNGQPRPSMLALIKTFYESLTSFHGIEVFNNV